MRKIKNIAIIAHVDHGKTTLVDCLLRQTGVFRENQQVVERVMDSNDLEREKGITIFSKNASLNYNGWRVNIVDTPGHADFGGEVQRIMTMVDSVLLLVDACEGTMPQTTYVLRKALEAGHRPIVVINKIDRPAARASVVLDMVFDLFVQLGATDEQLDFPVIYASAREGFARHKMTDTNTDIYPLLDTILQHVREPGGVDDHPLQFLVTSIDYDNYVGRMGTGRIYNGTMRPGDDIMLVKKNGEQVKGRILKVYTYNGLKRVETEEARAGEIVTVAGIADIDAGETLTDIMNPMPMPSPDIDRPTLAMNFLANDSPFMGKEGKYVTSTSLWERLMKEKERNVSLEIERTESRESFIVKGRGELQLAILIENMRREGYEFQVSKPEVIYRHINGVRCEPFEIAVVDVPDQYVGPVMEMMGPRRGEMTNMGKGSEGYSRLEFRIPARGLIGFRNEFLTETRGTGILTHSFFEYASCAGDIPGRNRGVLIAHEDGRSLAYALDGCQERGTLFIGPGVDVYEGMIVGENCRDGDLVVNVCKGKKLTNMRAAGSDDAVRLTPPREYSLEQALEYIEDDELLEVTPLSVRMRKKVLEKNDRKKAERQAV